MTRSDGHGFDGHGFDGHGFEVHILHDGNGRILAIAPAGPIASDDGSARGVTPVPAEGQFALRLTLSEEHMAAGPGALVRDFEVDLSADQTLLRPRTAG